PLGPARAGRRSVRVARPAAGRARARDGGGSGVRGLLEPGPPAAVRPSRRPRRHPLGGGHDGGGAGGRDGGPAGGGGRGAGAPGAGGRGAASPWRFLARPLPADFVLSLPTLLPAAVLLASALAVALLWPDRSALLAGTLWVGASTGALDALRGVGFLDLVWR